jgi:nucleotide-binding universal stress UspA family protein
MTGQITVGFDGTGASLEAVHWAVEEALLRRVPLRIVCCYEIASLGLTVPSWPATGAVDALLCDAQNRVDAVEREIRATHPELKTRVEASAGPASVVLLHGVEPDDVVVVGASSHADGAALFLGSTPRSLVRRSPCPVVVVRGAASRGRPDRIVVGIDGSPPSTQALLWAADEADRQGVELVVVHGWSYPYENVNAQSAQARDLTEIDAACVLERSIELARARCGVEVSGQLVERSPAAAVLESVRDGDLLVLGSRGRGAVMATLFGSVVNSVLDDSAVPVVVVPGPR